jgi:hypothetical protein
VIADAPRDAAVAAAAAGAALPDAAVTQAALPDAAVPDATVPDAAVRDAAVRDAAVPDAAIPDPAVPADASSAAAPPAAAGLRPARRAGLRALGAAIGAAAATGLGVVASTRPRPASAQPPGRAVRTGPPAVAEPFAFALIGDLPYSSADEAVLAAVLAATGREPLAFVLHVGDIKASRERCDDALFAHRRGLLERSPHPLVLLPGDNEWTDCGRWIAGGFDPLERLAALRAAFWATPDALGGGSRAGALGLERQPGFPENVRWRIGAVHLVTVHVVGSGNGRDGAPGSRAEFDARTAANRRWLADAVARALRERADALVIATHADPDFDSAPRPAFAPWVADLRAAAAAFPRPILLLHGDSHRFRVDHPLTDRDGTPVAHLTRVIASGWPFTSQWVRIAYDPRDPQRFRIESRPLRPDGP